MKNKNNSIVFSILLIALFATSLTGAYSQEILPPTCPSHQTSTHTTSGGGTMPRFAPKNDVLYGIRDKALAPTVKGKAYIEQYYFLGSIDKDFTRLSLKSLMSVINIMPSIYEAYDNYMDLKYTGVIVSEQLKDDLVEVLQAYKDLSDNKDYKTTIDGLIKDVQIVANMKKVQVNEFLNN